MPNYFPTGYGGYDNFGKLKNIPDETSELAGISLEDFISKLYQGNYGDMTNLMSLLEGAYSGGMPFKDELRQQSTGAISGAFDKAELGLKQNLSSSGLGRSGVGSVALADLYGEEGSALALNEANLNKMDVGFREGALGKMLGLTQLGTNYEMALRNLGEGQRQFDWGRRLQQEAGDKDVGDFLGSLIGQGLGTGLDLGLMDLFGLFD